MEKFVVWMVIDADGNHAVGTSPEAAREAYEQDVGVLADCDGFRMVSVVVSASLPAQVELTVSVADEDSGASVKAS